MKSRKNEAKLQAEVALLVSWSICASAAKLENRSCVLSSECMVYDSTNIGLNESIGGITPQLMLTFMMNMLFVVNRRYIYAFVWFMFNPRAKYQGHPERLHYPGYLIAP